MIDEKTINEVIEIVKNIINEYSWKDAIDDNIKDNKAHFNDGMYTVQDLLKLRLKEHKDIEQKLLNRYNGVKK